MHGLRRERRAILTYRVIQKSLPLLISELETLETAYRAKGERKKEWLYYEVRDAFNREPSCD